MVRQTHSLRLTVGHLSAMLIIGLSLPSYAQEPPCLPGYNGITYRLERLDSMINGNSSMPFDVLMAYWAANGVYHYPNAHDVYEAEARRVIFDDTTQKILKHYYLMVDYDPLLYKQVEEHTGAPDKIWINTVSSLIEGVVKRTSSHPVLDNALISSTYIFECVVTDTLTVLDTNLAPHMPIKLVEVKITDPIKGKTIPQCSFYNPLARLDGKPTLPEATSTWSYVNSEPTDSGDCFYFHYSPLWGFRGAGGSDFLTPGQELIAFLDMVAVCDDSTSHYVSPRPAGISRSLFLIDSAGIVTNSNPFGFGQNISADSFIVQLRARIDTIKSY